MFPNHEHSRMKLLGRNRLQPLYGLDASTDAWLRGWVAEMSTASWKQDTDVLRQFPRIQATTTPNVFLFPVANRPHYIEVAMIFLHAVALVVELKHLERNAY